MPTMDRTQFADYLKNVATQRNTQGRYGIPEDIANRYHSTAASSAYTAGKGVSNQIKRGLRSRGLGRSAGVLSASQAGAQTQADVLRQLLLPFAVSNAQSAQQARGADKDRVLREMAIRLQNALGYANLDLRRELQPRDSFGINTPYGGFSVPV